jgi:arsenical pump membrane protein
LLVGLVAADDGLFEAAGARLARLPGGELVLYVSLLALVAGVTAVLNLDTSVWFLTPVLVVAARSRGVDERRFLYAAVMMSNSASLILPGANLTNLIVLAHEHVSGATFASRIWPAWAAAVLVTAVVVHLAFHGAEHEPTGKLAVAAPRLGLGLAGIVVAAVLVLVLSRPALPVFGVGIALVLIRRTSWREIRETTGPFVLLGLFAVAVALGTLARSWGWPEHVATHAGNLAVAFLAAGLAVLVNNLPAAVLLSSHPPAHPSELLVGLNLGPNLFVTGSLSAFLWLRAARTVDARPSIRTFVSIGVVFAPLSILAAVGALTLSGAPQL